MRSFNNAVTRTSLVAALFVFALAASVAAAPQRRVAGRFVGPHGRIVIEGGLVDPFWGPYYPYGYAYPYGYGYPLGIYEPPLTPTSDLKTDVTPKQTEVYVDGYYAGVAADFDGLFHRLPTTPGGHVVTLHLDGYRTITENVYVRPGATTKLTEILAKLAPGEVSEPVGGSAPLR